MRQYQALAIPSLCLLVVTAAAQDKQDRAAKLLERAKNAASKGKYSRAVAIYKKVARSYEETDAAVVAKERAKDTAFLGYSFLVEHGPSTNRVDIVIMGDGFRLQDQNDFDDIAKRMPDLFKRHRTLGEYYSYHNFVRANLRSKDQGVTGYGRTKDTALGGFVSGNVQGQVAVDRRKVHTWLEQIDAHDSLVIAIVKAGSAGTGGAGIATIGGRADDTVIHEWGHAFGGLSDEYTAFTGHRGSARDTINIAAQKDPDRAPWAHMIAARVPGVGMYRGGDGRIKGVWRPTASGCAMAGGQVFCPVCREELVRRIYRYVDPIDGQAPSSSSVLTASDNLEFSVDVLEPDSHDLHVTWWVLPEQSGIQPAAKVVDRRRRGALQPIPWKPARKATRAGGQTRKFRFRPDDFERGRYQIVCRVEDRARPSGQARPWVLRDPEQLLWSERVWTVTVR